VEAFATGGVMCGSAQAPLEKQSARKIAEAEIRTAEIAKSAVHIELLPRKLLGSVNKAARF
jgi:hypothetical protein